MSAHVEFGRATAQEAEHRIVSICATWPEAIERVVARPDDFLDVRWRKSFEALLELHAEHGGKIDSLVLLDSVCDRLDGKLSLSDFICLDGTPDLVESYSAIVREEAAKRRLKLGLGSVVNGLKSGLMAIEDALTAASKAISEATLGQPDDAQTIGQIVVARARELAEIGDRIARGDASAVGIPTGIDKLDEVMGGIQLGIPTLIAARPSMGKSAFALNLANHASKSGIGVHEFSLEDSAQAKADRVLSMGSGVPGDAIRSCRLNRGQMQDLHAAGTRILDRKGWLVDSRSGITAEEVIRCVRRHRESNSTKLVIVDYVQLLRGHRGQDKRLMLEDAIYAFGDAAKQDEMAYVVLSQLNRSLESRDDKRPRLSDLKESGALEERAKAIVMLYRPSVYGDKYERGQYHGNERPGQRIGEAIPETVIELLVRKNSNGRTGTVLAEWRPERMQIK